MSEQTESFGRIEVAPEVLATIAYFATVRTEGVNKLGNVPSDMARMFRRSAQKEGVLLDLTDNKVKFDIYVIMEPHVNIMNASRQIQTSVAEAIDTMVGVPVSAVNIHVENVLYEQGETA